METIRVTTKGSIVKGIGIFTASLVVFLVAVNMVSLDFQKFFERIENVPAVVGRMLAIDMTIVPAALLSILTSLALAFVTLAVAVILAGLLSFLAAANIAPNRIVAGFIKGLFAVIRSVPSLVWGLMVIASLGFGNTAGFITILLSAVGYLVKSFTGSIEEAGTDIIEAMRSTGASWLSIVFHGLLPLCITSFVSWMTVRFEANIAESIGLGIIGVAGIGLLLNQSISTYNYPQTTTILIMICMLMFTIELIVTRIKNKIKYGENGG